jgi:hypothetical protein
MTFMHHPLACFRCADAHVVAADRQRKSSATSLPHRVYEIKRKQNEDYR